METEIRERNVQGPDVILYTRVAGSLKSGNVLIAIIPNVTWLPSATHVDFLLIGEKVG